MHRRRALGLLGGTLGGLLLPQGPARACDLFPKQDGWRFLVLRHGNVIGEHHFTFSRRGDDFVVEVAIDIADLVAFLESLSGDRLASRARERQGSK